MNQQRDLFGSPRTRKPGPPPPPAERYQAAVICSAVGDALGWPIEFLRQGRSTTKDFVVPIRDFVRWEKLVGGRWWGYRDSIGQGEYSDDTQLALAVARCISSTGQFEPERFAYSEFPLWLHYERGGGRAIKTAARALISRKGDWLDNFYRRGPVDYRRAGANGAAMRNLPIALASYSDMSRLVRDSFFNAVVSHGHPRAILGTILIGLAVRDALSEPDSPVTNAIESLRTGLDGSERVLSSDQRVVRWVKSWADHAKGPRESFWASFNQTLQETHRNLGAIPDFIERPVEDYYHFVGALSPETKGSGVATTCVAVFLSHKFRDAPFEALVAAANQLGSDTDSIAAFVGGLTGARVGKEAVPGHLWERVQDRDYLAKIGAHLHTIASGETGEHTSTDVPLQQKDAFLMILAWEMGLHEMFWDAIGTGGEVVHPTLGRGTVGRKEVRAIGREGFVAKLIRIAFDSGQTCIFHSRVASDEKVSESLAKEVEHALAG